MSIALCELFGDPSPKGKPRERDLRASIVAAYACPECGAPKGEPCRRMTVTGKTVVRGLPHLGRSLQKPPRQEPRPGPAKRGPKPLLSDEQKTKIMDGYWIARTKRVLCMAWYEKRGAELGVSRDTIYRVVRELRGVRE